MMGVAGAWLGASDHLSAVVVVLLAMLGACEAGLPTAQVQPRRTAVPASTATDSPPFFRRVPARHEVVVDGHPLAVWHKAPAGSTVGTFVLLHGRTWSSLPDFDLQVAGEQRSLMDALVRAGFAVYAVDLRGYGATARDATGWNEPRRAAADLAGVVAWVVGRHGRPVVLLGWSLGAMVAQLCAQDHPEQIQALVLYGYPSDPDAEAPVPDDSPPQEPRRLANSRQAALADFITPGSISAAARETFARAALAADPTLVDWRSLHEFNALDPTELVFPTLLIHGEHDPLAAPDSHEKLLARIAHPLKQRVIIAQGDHAAHLEDAGPHFVDAIVAFARRARSSPAAAAP